MAKKKHTSKATKSGGASANLIRSANDYCMTMNAFFEMAQREIAEKNNSDFDNIGFLIKGDKAEWFLLSGLISKAEDALEGGAS